MIDPRAAVDPQAELAEDVEVGPFTVIGPEVRIGAGTRVGAHTVISGPTRIGRENTIAPFVSLGEPPQDKKYDGAPTRLEIGDRNTVREFCTFNRGTTHGGGVTRVGDDNWIMAYVHVAHDCQVGDSTVFANAATLAGHVEVGDYAVLGGFTLVHQFCRLGAHCFTGMGSAINRDVLPFMVVSGAMARARGVNSEGLRRRGFTPEQLRSLKQAYRVLYKSGLQLQHAVERLGELAATEPLVGDLLAFLDASERGILR